ncbi:MAG: acyl-CoA dehydrogenase family protein [Thermoplasmatota archaeon]
MVDFSMPEGVEAIRSRAAQFVASEAIPAEARIDPALDLAEPANWAIIMDLREKARKASLWLPHLEPAWGGLGLTLLELAMVSQELGAAPIASLAVNCMAPDEGNMHTLLAFGTKDQQERYLRPLADGRIRSCFAMTERAAGSDPRGLQTVARKEGDHWRIEGTKWFATGARGAAFGIVVAKTEPGYSLFIVDTHDHGWSLDRTVPVMGAHAPGGHGEITLSGARGELLGELGHGLEHAQARLGIDRITHAMRWIGTSQRALDMMATYAQSRTTFGTKLADRQAIQWMIAESATELHLARLLVLHAAWKVDQGLPHRTDISMVKVFVAQTLQGVVDRAVQVHGALGYSEELPLARMYRDARAARIYDGPDEVHQAAIARAVLQDVRERGTSRPRPGSAA